MMIAQFFARALNMLGINSN